MIQLFGGREVGGDEGSEIWFVVPGNMEISWSKKCIAVGIGKIYQNNSNAGLFCSKQSFPIKFWLRYAAP